MAAVFYGRLSANAAFMFQLKQDALYGFVHIRVGRVDGNLGIYWHFTRV